MKKLNYISAILFISSSLLFTACGGEEQSPLEVKKKELEKSRQEFATLKAKIEKLESEISSEENVDPKASLKRVTANQLSTQMFEHYIEVPGNVQSDKNVLINPEISGIITKRYVEEGQSVTQGQTLAEIDASLVRKNIAEVKTRLELAETIYNRQKNLWDQKVGSEVQYLQAKNSKESLERNLETLNEQLRKAFVKSPITGVVDEFFFNSGEMATPSAPIVRVVNLSKVEISAEVSENYTQSVLKGDTVTVKFPALNMEMPVKIGLVGQFINPKNRTFRIEMKVNNQKTHLKPNTMAVVKIKDFYQDNAIVVPSHIIQKSTSGDKFLYIVRKEGDTEISKKVNIEIAKSYKGKTLVTSGLKAGDRIIIKGYNEVIDGEEINVVPDDDLSDMAIIE